MRIASLLPSATEIVCALGLEADLVAITHECDHPPSVARKPVVTSSVLPAAGSSGEIDRHIRKLVHEGSSIYALDQDRLMALQPDLILTQELCAVCAVSYPIVEKASHRLQAPTQLVSLEPESLDDVFDNIRLVGQLTGRAQAAEAVVAALTARIDAVRRRVAGRPRRRIVALEWIEPPYRSGHWTPGLVRLAGAEDLLGRPGQRAAAIDWRQIDEAGPEVVVVMACGFTLERSLDEVERIAPRLAGRECFVVDGNAFFSRPGPRLVDSVEILAGILHPEAVPPPPGTVARRVA